MNPILCYGFQIVHSFKVLQCSAVKSSESFKDRKHLICQTILFNILQSWIPEGHVSTYKLDSRNECDSWIKMLSHSRLLLWMLKQFYQELELGRQWEQCLTNLHKDRGMQSFSGKEILPNITATYYLSEIICYRSDRQGTSMVYVPQLQH